MFSAPARARQLVLLIATAKGAFFYHTDERREQWKLTGPHLAGWDVYSLCGDSRRGRVLAGAGNFMHGVALRASCDLGGTWETVKRGPANPTGPQATLKHIWQIVPGHPAEPDTWYAGVDDAGLFVSRDDGRTWTELDGLTRHPTRPHWPPGNGGLCLHTILVDPSNPRRLWVAISAVGVFRSEDSGASWQLCNTDLHNVAPAFIKAENMGRCVHKMALDPHAPGVLYQQFHGGVFKSTDAGDTWTSIASGLPSDFGFPIVATPPGSLFVVPLQADQNRVVPDGALKVWRSRDRGASWQLLTAGLPQESHYVGVLRDAMTTDPFEPAGIYFGTTMGECFIRRTTATPGNACQPNSRASRPSRPGRCEEAKNLNVLRYRGQNIGAGHAVLDGEARQAGHVVQVELFHQVRAVIFGGLDADFEFGGDFLRAEAFGDELQNFAFARGEGFEVLAVGLARVDDGFAQEAGDERPEIGAAVGDGLDAFAQFGQARGFFDKAVGAGLEQLAHEGRILEPGKDQHAGVLEVARKALEHVHAVEAGQHHVEDDEIGLELKAGGAGGLPVATFGDDFKLVVHAQHRGEELADGYLVFNENNTFHESFVSAI